MGGNHSSAASDTPYIAISNKKEVQSKSFFQRKIRQQSDISDSIFCSVMSAKERATGNYPYPRHHSTLVLAPRSRLILPPPAKPFPISRIPPLNRSIPPIPESRSDESLRTVSSMSASNSRYNVVAGEAASSGVTPLDENKVAVFSNENHLKSVKPEIVVENRLAAVHFPDSQTTSQQRFGETGVFQPLSPSLTPKAKSPLFVVASRMRSKLGRIGKFRSVDNNSTKSSTGSSQGSSHSLTKISNEQGAVVQNTSFDNRERTVSESTSEIELKRDFNANVDMQGLISKTKSLEITPTKAKGNRDCSTVNQSSQLQSPKGYFNRKKVVTEKVPNKDRAPVLSSSQCSRSTSTPVVSVLQDKGSVPSSSSSDAVPNARTIGAMDGVSSSVYPAKPSLNLDRPSNLQFDLSVNKRVLGHQVAYFAPLAESESSTVENSPAVEIPSGGLDWVTGQYRRLKKYQKVKSSPLAKHVVVRQTEYKTGNKPSLESIAEPRWTNPTAYANARLKPSSASQYANNQQLIYGSTTRPYPGSSEQPIINCLDDPIEPIIVSVAANPKQIEFQQIVTSFSSADEDGKDKRLVKTEGVHSPAKLRFLNHIDNKLEISSTPKVSFGATCALEKTKERTNSQADTSDDTLVEFSTVSSQKVDVTKHTSSVLPSANSLIRSPLKCDTRTMYSRRNNGCSSNSSSAADSANSNSKLTSPSSENRGLIDDEIKDQPELTLTASSTMKNIISSESSNVEAPHDLVGAVKPSRISIGGRRSRSSTLTMRDSIVSTTSLDSEDCMADYESSVDYGHPDQDDDTMSEMSELSESALLRRRSWKEATGSLDRRPARNRESVELAIEELGLIMGAVQRQTARSSNQSQKVSSASYPPLAEPGVSGASGDAAWLSKAGDSNNNRNSSDSNNRAAPRDPAAMPTAPRRWTNSSSKDRPGEPTATMTSLRPPAATLLAGDENAVGGHVGIDAHVYRSVTQDITVLKTLLHRLKGELQHADTINPLVGPSAALTLTDKHPEPCPKEKINVQLQESNELLQKENADLKKQVETLQRQLSEKDALVLELRGHVDRLTKQRKRIPTPASAAGGKSSLKNQS